MMKWTRTTPTVEGYYWKRHGQGHIANPTVTICYVGKAKTTAGWRVQSQGPKQGYTEYGHALGLFQPAVTEWAGPIPEPK